MTEIQRWDLTVRGRRHRVEITGGAPRTVRWYADDDLLATRTTADDTVRLAPEDGGTEAVRVKFTALGRTRRVTLFEDTAEQDAEAQALLGLGGIDLDPEAGSPAALREQRIREHPGRYAAIAAAGGVAKVVVPLVLSLLAVRFVVDLPWPSWDIPWPEIDLPSIPWPDIDLPDIDLPDWQAPAWLAWILERARFVWPVVLALVLARGEIARRRKQDALKAELAGQADDESGSTMPAEPADRDTTP
ncbi:hypothetical protein [Georgenia subflava]|uniref:Uncharacterized protein n=1 Tax=Georgenia subflava TaxID=1622177 RepID=A0A6N7EFV8_9MICO|nr:hypothetical protein [Georgenia subflava]MPV36281.1 hypothetical protein [Georgenia subflava]